MKLSSTDWIFTGDGLLYSPPLLSRCLLFRLYDVDHSFLIYHSPSVSSSSRILDEPHPLEATAVVNEVDTVFIHNAHDATLPLEELRSLTSAKLQLTAAHSLHSQFAGIGLHLELCHIPASGMCLLKVRDGRRHDYAIADTEFRLRSPVPIVSLRSKMRRTEERLKAWRIVLANLHADRLYTLGPSSTWSVTSVIASQKRRSNTELHVEKKP